VIKKLAERIGLDPKNFGDQSLSRRPVGLLAAPSTSRDALPVVPAGGRYQ
jgi:hypothetical protein